MAYNNKKYTKEQLESAAKISESYSDIFRNLGIKVNGGSYNWLKGLLYFYEIDVSHFPPRINLLINAGNVCTKERLEKMYLGVADISTEHRLSAKKLTTYMLMNGIEEKCNKCGLSEWQCAPIRFDVDHVDNNSINNTLSNLQFICPNCHRQKTIPISYKKRMGSVCKTRAAETTKKIQNRCASCQKPITKGSHQCMKCAKTGSYKIKWPDKETLQKMVWEIPTSQIGRLLNISDSAITKHCKRNGLTKPPVGYWRKKQFGLI